MVGYTGVVQYVYTVCIYTVCIYTVCIYIQYVYIYIHIYTVCIYIYNVFGLRIKTISPLVSSALCIPQVWFLFSPLVPSLLLWEELYTNSTSRARTFNTSWIVLRSSHGGAPAGIKTTKVSFLSGTGSNSHWQRRGMKQTNKINVNMSEHVWAVWCVPCAASPSVATPFSKQVEDCVKQSKQLQSCAGAIPSSKQVEDFR